MRKSASRSGDTLDDMSPPAPPQKPNEKRKTKTITHNDQHRYLPTADINLCQITRHDDRYTGTYSTHAQTQADERHGRYPRRRPDMAARAWAPEATRSCRRRAAATDATRPATLRHEPCADRDKGRDQRQGQRLSLCLVSSPALCRSSRLSLGGVAVGGGVVFSSSTSLG